MGQHKNITIDKFPKQGSHLNKEVTVMFHYNTANTIKGIVVRDDEDDPGKTIIKLEDGRYVLSTECQYS